MSGSASDIGASPDHVGQFTALFVAPSRFPGGSARAASAQAASLFTVERARARESALGHPATVAYSTPAGDGVDFARETCNTAIQAHMFNSGTPV
jgi:hypothetical protein